MHRHFERGSQLTEVIIASAIAVHRAKGPGLMESVYEWCLKCELQHRALRLENQCTVRIEYRGQVREEPLRCDLLVENAVLVEIKAVERIMPIHQAQLLTYMKLLDVPLGLLVNFNVPLLTQGIKRVILPGANRSAISSP
ncbi:MAG: GxxExxY protein [Verrucomicrobia bacterium]|nr:GxxExxY protein [Verrucomicrobiota bacterium]